MHSQTEYDEQYYQAYYVPGAEPNAAEITSSEKDQLTQITNLLGADRPTLNSYAILTHDNHTQNISVTWGEVLKGIIPVTGSYLVGGVASYVFVGVSLNAAGDNWFNKIAYPLGGFTLNFLVNSYFILKPIAAGMYSLFPLKAEVRKAWQDLRDQSPGILAALGRGAQHIGRVVVTAGPAAGTAYPSYQLSITESHDPKPLAITVGGSTTMLQYNGVQALLFKFIPALIFSPFKWAYRKFNDTAMRNYKIETTVGMLKSAHKEAIYAAQREFLRMKRTHDNPLFQDIAPLLMKENPTKPESIQLLMKFLAWVKKDEHQASPIGRLITQLVSTALTLASLPGYFVVNKEGISDFIQLDSAFKEWLLSSSIFLVSIALSLDVGWDVGGDVYDLFSNFTHGIKKSWQESASTFDFLKKAWNNKGNFASWHNLIKFPLAVQQNPRLMLGLLSFLYGLSYFSTQTSTYLNDEKLGRSISQYLELATIISVMLFNSFPVDKVLGSAQQFFARLLGNSTTKQEIKGNQFLTNQAEIVNDTEDYKFLNVLGDIIESGQLTPLETEQFFITFFGNKTPEELFGVGHKYAKRRYIDIIPRLINKETFHELSRFSALFPGSRRGSGREKQPLFANADANLYGTGDFSHLDTKLKKTSFRSVRSG